MNIRKIITRPIAHVLGYIAIVTDWAWLGEIATRLWFYGLPRISAVPMDLPRWVPCPECGGAREHVEREDIRFKCERCNGYGMTIEE